ncbi:MAG: hypothetical protein E6447_16180, partial [Bradyrhizobium sp.]|nr:hypothetical protein [Bradyrhizobium sp.]
MAKASKTTVKKGKPASAAKNKAAAKSPAKAKSPVKAGAKTKAKDKDAKERYKMLAREVAEQANAAARRLLISADNVADSYARAMRQAAAAEL